MTVTGSLTNNAGNTGLVIKSTNSGTGSLINNTAGVNATMERYLSKTYFHYISSPVAAQAISPEFINTGAPVSSQGLIDFYSWDETVGDLPWINIKADATTWNGTFGASFEVGKGYNFADDNSDVTKNFTGTLNSGDKSVVMSLSGTGQNGWHLIGNPFPSYMAANTSADGTNNLLTDNNSLLAESNTALYFWDEQPGYVGASRTNEYKTVNNASAAYFVNPGQAFMVKTAANGNSFQLKQASRKHGSSIFYKSTEETDISRFYLTITSPQNFFNETMVAMVPGATDGLDVGYDAKKLRGNASLALYTHLTNGTAGDFAIQSIDKASGDFIVPVGIDANVAGTYTFRPGQMDNLDYITVKLEDRQANIFTDMTPEAAYVFDVTTTGKVENRFYLHLKSSVGIDNPATTVAPTIYTYANQLYISRAGNATVEVINMAGQVSERFRVNETGTFSRQLNLTAGTYVVRVISGNTVRTERIVIN